MQCMECEDEATPPHDDLCQSCKLDRVLNDMMHLTPKMRAQVAMEALSYDGTMSIISVGLKDYPG